LLAQVYEARKKQESRNVIPLFMRLALVTALVLVFLVVGGNSLFSAAAGSLPGDSLYGIKRTAENAQLLFAFSSTQKLALEDEFYQRRISETESLLVSRRAVEVKFSGLVEARLPDGWLVSGIRVMVTPQTEVDEEIVTGMHVEVEGITQLNDTVLAKKIRIESDEHEEDGSSSQSGPGKGQATESPHPESGETPHSGDGSSNSGSGSSGNGGSGGSGSSTQASNSGSNQGSGDATRTPEPTRTLKPTRTPEPTKTKAPTKTPEPSKTDEPTRTPEPTK
jgi:uncharacterized membrane protein YgcG